MKAVYKDTIIAESDQTVLVEGYHYFPPEAIHREYLQDSPLHTTCPRKGQASYYHVTVNGETLRDAAWYYPQPNQGYNQIKSYVAFYAGVETLQ